MTTKIEVGAKASRSKAFSSQDVWVFAAVSTDINPIHLDEEVAKAGIFKQRVVHGQLVSSLFSGLLGCELPGQGTIFMGQSLKFRAPVFLDQKITASVEIVNIRTDKPIITLKTSAVNEDGIVVIEGEATVLFPDLNTVKESSLKL